MKIKDLFEGGCPPFRDILPDDIVVVVGKNIPKVRLEAVGVVPEVNFANYKEHLDHRGIFVCPEGFTKLFESGEIISNHPEELVKQASEIISSGFKGFILSNNHIFIEALYLYGKEYDRNVVFYIMVEDRPIRVPECEMSAVWRELNGAINTLSMLSSMLEERGKV